MASWRTAGCTQLKLSYVKGQLNLGPEVVSCPLGAARIGKIGAKKVQGTHV